MSSIKVVKQIFEKKGEIYQDNFEIRKQRTKKQEEYKCQWVKSYKNKKVGVGFGRGRSQQIACANKIRVWDQMT